MLGQKTELNRELDAMADEAMEGMDDLQIITESETEGIFIIDTLDTSKGKNNLYQMECGCGCFYIFPLILFWSGRNED